MQDLGTPDRDDAVLTLSDSEEAPGPLPGPRLHRRSALALLALTGTSAAAAGWRSTFGPRSPCGDGLPVSPGDRREPLRLRTWLPAPSRPIPEEDISELVRKVRLRGDMSFSDLLHWLRVFSGRPEIPGSGAPVDSVLGELTDAGRLRRRFDRPSCLVRTLYGARYLHAPRTSAAGPERGLHAHQALATFAEIGVGLDRKLALPDGESTVAGLLRDLMANFQARRVTGSEPEWAAVALFLYVPPDRSWRNRWGETLDLQAVAEFLAGATHEGAACGGIHSLTALAVARQVDRAHSILSRTVSGRIAGSLDAATRALVASQADDGSWSDGWDGRPARRPRTTGDAVHVTGHLLEWQSLLPPEEQAPRACLGRALRFLAEVTLEACDEEVAQLYCPFSHAVRVVLAASDPGGRTRAACPPRAARPARRGLVLAGGPGAG